MRWKASGYNFKYPSNMADDDKLRPVFFVEGGANPEHHLQQTVKLMTDAEAWICITIRQHPLHGLEVDVKSANLSAEQLNQILQYAVKATGGPLTSKN